MGTVEGEFHDVVVNNAFSKFKENTVYRNTASRMFVLDLSLKVGETREKQSKWLWRSIKRNN